MSKNLFSTISKLMESQGVNINKPTTNVYKNNKPTPEKNSKTKNPSAPEE